MLCVIVHSEVPSPCTITGLPASIRPSTVQRPSNGTSVCVVGVRRPHDRRRNPVSRYCATSRSSQAILSREYCQNGFRSGVDSVTGSRAGGVWYADAEEMNTYCPVRPRNRSMSL